MGSSDNLEAGSGPSVKAFPLAKFIFTKSGRRFRVSS